MFGWSQKEKDQELLTVVYAGKYSETNIDALAALLKKKADPNLVDAEQRPLLYLAASKYSDSNCSKAVRLLLDAGAEVKGSAPYYPLHVAIEQGNDKTVGLLVKAGACVVTPDEKGAPPLLQALHPSKENIVRLLIDNGALEIADQTLFTDMFCRAADINLKDHLYPILDRIEDINARTTTNDRPLHAAVRLGGYAGVPLLEKLLARPDINIDAGIAEGRTALLWPIQQNAPDKLRRLLAAGASVAYTTADGKSPVYYAAKTGSITSVSAIIEAAKTQGENVLGPYLDEALMAAAEGGFGRVAEMLIEAGANPDYADAVTAQTPLMKAVKENNVEILDVLIKAGADPDALDRSKLSAYDHAVSYSAARAKDFLQKYRKEIPVLKAGRNDNECVKLGDHVLEVKQGGGLSLVFNFWIQQVIYRDTANNLPLAVKNFDEVQRQDAIVEAYEKLKQMGGAPAELSLHKAALKL